MSRTLTIRERIHCENEARRLLAVAYRIGRDHFSGLTGKKVLRADGSLTKAASVNIEPDGWTVKPLREGETAEVQWCYLKSTAYAVWAEVSLCFHGGSYDNRSHYCHYVRASACVCDIQDGIAGKIYDHPNTAPFDADEQEAIYKNAWKLKEQYETERDRLHYALREDFKR